MGATRPHNPAARGELLGALPHLGKSRPTEENKTDPKHKTSDTSTNTFESLDHRLGYAVSKPKCSRQCFKGLPGDFLFQMHFSFLELVYVGLFLTAKDQAGCGDEIFRVAQSNARPRR